MNARGNSIIQNALIFYSRLLKEEVPEGQTDGVNKTAQICKSPKIDVTSINPICHHIRHILRIAVPVCMHS